MRFIRRLALLLLTLLLLLLAAVHLLGDPIARRVVRSLNARVQTPITVGQYDLSLLRAFPHLAVDLQQVHVGGSDGSTLLEAEHLTCILDLVSIFGTPRIDAIRVHNGKLQLFTDRDGNTNYQVTHTSVGDQNEQPTGGAAGAKFLLRAAQFTDVTVVYQDARLRTDAVITVREGSLDGNFGASTTELRTDSQIEVVYFDQDGTRYLDRKAFGLSGAVNINQEKASYRFTPVVLTARDLTIEITGVLTLTERGITTNLRLSSTAGELGDVLALLPPDYTTTLGELETEGQLALAADITGEWTERDYPHLNGHLTFTDGRLRSPRMNATARDVTLRATFAYLDGPRGGLQTFAIEALSGTFAGSPFDFQLRLEDLADPYLTFSGRGSLPLDVLPALLPEAAAVTEATGLLHLNDLTLSGRYADMVEPRRAGRVNSTGTLRLEDAHLMYRETPIALPSGTLVLDDNEVTVTDLTVALPKTSCTLNGRGSNFIPVLFSDSLNSRDAALRFTATLTGERLDVSEVLTLTGAEGIEVGDTAAVLGSATPPVQRVFLTDLLHGTFEADVSDWQWDEMHGKNFRGQLVFLPGRLDVRGLTAAMGGEFRIDAITYFGDSTTVEARVEAEAVDAPAFFRQCDNFGQEVLTADHLTGQLDAQLLLDMTYDATGVLDYERLGVRASLEVLNGELRDFSMLENFAFALKSGDLERVRFTRLANVFEIRDRTIYIPAMFIQSSAINLTLSGRHTFDQYLDYNIKVNAGQVVTNKLSRHNSALEVLPARNGLFNVYYTVRGPLETYTVQSDKRAVKTDFRRSLYRRDRIRRELSTRFRTPITLFDLSSTDDAVE